MIIGVPSTPRFVAAIDPRKSDTDTTIVRLYPSGTSPGGTLVLRVGDIDQDDDSWFNSVDSLYLAARKGKRGRDSVDASLGASSAHTAFIFQICTPFISMPPIKCRNCLVDIGRMYCTSRRPKQNEACKRGLPCPAEY